MKICNKCKINKSLSEFSNRKTSKDGKDSTCKECRAIYRASVRDKTKSYNLQYRKDNKEAMSASHKEWQSENREHIKEYNKSYQIENKEAMSEYYLDNKDRLLDGQKAYRKTVMGKAVSANYAHKRRVISSGGNLPMDSRDYPTSKELQELKVSQENKCAYCDCDLDYITPKAVHLDHVIPLSKGGTHTLDNVVWSCATCNMSKGASLIA